MLLDRRLTTLDEKFRPLAVELLARCVEAGIPVLIVNTRRTATEQAELRRKGLSWVRESKHQLGLAIDIAPYEVYLAHGADKVLWNAEDPLWGKLGEIGKGLGLTWGGDWKARDLGHFEMKEK
jgi:peptidoglycan LD-endopeptidase CwlK